MRRIQFGSSMCLSKDWIFQRWDLEEAIPKERGRPPYDPGDLLRLYVYGYLNRTRSSRQLEREAGRNVELMWLMRKLRPDFKTIADFRKDNQQGAQESMPRVYALV